MRKYLTYIVFFLFISCDDNSFNLFGPQHHGDSMAPTHPTPIGNNELIDATSYSQWEYYKITEDSLLHIQFVWGGDFENSDAWDIAFQRNHIKTNSGTSGIGNAGVYIDSIQIWNGTTFNDLYEIQADYNYTVDKNIKTFYNQYNHTYDWGDTNPNLETWGEIDTTNNYTMMISNNKFIVRTANEQSFYKFWPFDYYNTNGESGYISLVYDFICTLDCTGECGGDAEVDICGECNGTITDSSECEN